MENNRKIIESINFRFQKFFIKTEKYIFKNFNYFFLKYFPKSLFTPLPILFNYFLQIANLFN